MHSILIVDDEEAIRASLSFALEDRFRVFTAGSGQAALDRLKMNEIDLVLLDLRLGNEDGLRVLEQIKAFDEQIVVIMMTAYGSIKSSIDAIKAGAFHYVTKPIDMAELNVIVANALEFIGLRSKVKYLNRKLTQSYELSEMIGQSATMMQIKNMIERVSNVESSVLITGESGTGKELVAKAIHFGGKRRHEPFEALNCAAIPAELLESELFGHEKGAFTGATQRKKGFFELAHGGTLFLDEIAEMDIKLQAKLLRAVQEKEIMPVGSAQRRKVDVRIISATNRDLQQMIVSRNFRDDLFFRLNVVTIAIPPLRERKEDILLLIESFLHKYNRKMGRQINMVEPDVLTALMRYDYRGNVRELENIIERAMVFSDSDTIQLSSLPIEVRPADDRSLTAPQADMKGIVQVRIGEDLSSVEEKLILATIDHFGGDKTSAARSLKISERKLWYKLKEYNENKRNQEITANSA